VAGANGTIGSAAKKASEEKEHEVCLSEAPRGERGAERVVRNVIRWKCTRFVIS
jgi:hypothetical protein